MSLKERLYNYPFLQGVIALILYAISFSVIVKFNLNGIIADCWLCLFVVANPLAGIFQKQWARYTLQSIGTLIFITIAMYIFTHVMITNASSSSYQAAHKFVIICLTAFYFMLMALSYLFRSIIYGLMNE